MNADLDGDKPENRVQSREGRPAGQDGAYPVEDAGLEFAPEPMSPPTGGSSTTSSDQTAVWYAGRRGGQRAGPYTLPALKKLLAAGTLSPRDLVWKAGMPNWLPAREIADLTTRMGGPAGAPRLPRSLFDRCDELLRHFNGILSNAAFYRILGPTCIGLGLITFLMSVLLSFWHLTWFTGAVLFLAIGLGGEATGHVLDLLHRIESQLTERAKPRKDSPDNGSGHD